MYGVNIRIIRIFNTYGPYLMVNDGRVVSNFIMQAINGNDITVYGEGNQTRSFCFVDDLVEGMIKTMKLEEDYCAPINLGNPNEVSINYLANEVIGLTNSISKIVYKELPIDDPKIRRPDISAAKNILGWEPQVSLEMGLNKTINYFIRIR